MISHSRPQQLDGLDRFALELAGIRRRFADQDNLRVMSTSRADLPLPPVGASGVEWQALLEAVARRLRRVADTTLAVPDPDGKMADRTRVLECAEALVQLRGWLGPRGWPDTKPPQPPHEEKCHTMTYIFHSRATGDVLMLRPDTERVLDAMCIAPSAKGILRPEDMPAAIGAIEAVIKREESVKGTARTHADRVGPAPLDDDQVSLRQRAWALVTMMKRAHAEGEAIVWGV